MKRLLQDRKTLYLVLAIVMVSVFTLSVAYAAMSAVLEIHGNSEVVASSWDIYLDNVKVTNGSVSANTPQISGTSTLSFDVDLNIPGDFYEFTVDVVNDGAIDAMIDSFVITPNLTNEQAKYIKYEVTYQNGENISTNQTLKKSTRTPIKVRVEYRIDISASDLPSSATELSLKLTLVYMQSDGSGTSIPNNGANLVNIVNGTGTNVGDEVCFGSECFYVLSSTTENVTFLAKYNLYVGGEFADYGYPNYVYTAYDSEATGIQNPVMLGYISGNTLYEGVTPFATDEKHGEYYADYSGSLVEQYVNSYDDYLSSIGLVTKEARLITEQELVSICSDEILVVGVVSFCPSWIYSTSYWIDGKTSDSNVISVCSDSSYMGMKYDTDNAYGVRPVIVVSKDYL